MIDDWRAGFQQPNLPFYFVLLAAYRSGGSATVGLRLSQQAALNRHFTGVASAIDAGDESSPEGGVHPRNKTIIGQRLALQVRKQVYGQAELIADGPTVSYRDIFVNASGSRVDVTMTYIAGPQNAGL